MRSGNTKTTKYNFHIKKTSCIIRLYLKVSQFGYSLSLWGKFDSFGKMYRGKGNKSTPDMTFLSHVRSVFLQHIDFWFLKILQFYSA